MEEESPMYVSIENSVSLRKGILENAIHATEMLKDYEHFKIIRDKKTKKLQELRGLVFDIRKTQRSLMNSLPDLPEEKEEVKEKTEEKEIIIKEEPKKVERIVKIEPPKVAVSKEEDDLTKELMEIQKKLRAL